MFDWSQLLSNRGITYVHTSRTQIETRCPFCIEDPSHHMSINLEGKGWRCWRRPAEHYGKSPIKLIMAILHCTDEQAREIAGYGTQVPDDYFNRVCDLLSPRQAEANVKEIALPSVFKQFRPQPRLDRLGLSRNQFPVSSWPFLNYLTAQERGSFKLSDIARFPEYDVYYCKAGAYKARIIFVVRMNGKIMSWTGRTIIDDALRYRALTSDEEKAAKEGMPAAIRAVNHCLLWFDELNKLGPYGTLYICEGPFDALKLRCLGARSTCLFTQSPSEEQVGLLHELAPKFRQTVLLLDQGTLPVAMQIQSKLTGLDVGLKLLPEGIKDPCMLRSLDSLS